MLTKILNFIKKYFVVILVVVVFIIFYLKGCFGSHSEEPTVTTKIDTVWVRSTDTLKVYTPPVIITLPGKTEIITKYIPDTTYDGLRAQYQKLVVSHTNQNIYRDDIKLDSIGNVHIVDTVSENKLQGRNVSYEYKIPYVTKTVTITQPYKPRNQVYLGLEAEATSKGKVSGAAVGVMLKNKSDGIIGVTAGYNFDKSLQFGAKYYHVLSFRKK